MKDFKTILNEINFQIEIVDIFNKIEPKAENITKIFKELQNYKKNIEQKINEKSSNISFTKSFKKSKLNKKFKNINETLNFIEEIQFAKQTILENEFISDWRELNQYQIIGLSPEEILDTAPLLQEQINSINNDQAQTNGQNKCCPKICTIL